MPLTLVLNGQSRSFDLPEPASVENVVDSLGLKGDRIAVEFNGEIVPRASWGATLLREGDRLEMVHFVGGGSWERPARASSSASH